MRTNLASRDIGIAVEKSCHRPHNLEQLQVTDQEVEVGYRPQGTEQSYP